MNDLEKEKNIRHREKMIKKQKGRFKIESQAVHEKGLMIVNTGMGKGKSTAAFGMVLRAMGHGMRVGVVQFGKGSRATGEKLFLEKFSDQITFYARGQGFTWETQDRERDILSANEAWKVAKTMLEDPTYHTVLCDELNIMMRYQYLKINDILEAVEKRPTHQHVIITGRNAPEAFIEKADLVTNMEMIKHPFRNGIKAQKGIEF